MAQPVFDGHPLEEYFRDSGEASELMPGGTAEFSLQSYLTGHPPIFKHSERMEKLCFNIFGALESVNSFFSSDRMSLRAQAFAERFKYGVISSSLLSSACTATPVAEPHRRGLSLSLPGKLPSGHSRTPSAAESTTTDIISLSMPPEPETPFWPITLSFTVAVAALSARFYFLTFVLLAGTLYYMHVHRLNIHSKPDVMTLSLQALQSLISAGRLWDSVINDTLAMLENEERNIFYSPTSPLTPSSSLRVALSTSLLTTQKQCDNVRQLLSAITSPSELTQLAEMYAPPSPKKSSFTLNSHSQRPLSHPGSSQPPSSVTDRTKKRVTWNGSYASLALAGTPPAFQLLQRREKRRSDLSAVLGPPSPSPTWNASRSALSTPPQMIADVSEEEDGMVTAVSSFVENEENEADASFGSTALGLYRKRFSGGLSQRIAPLSLTRGKSMKRRTTMSPGSKYTSMHATRHPLSLSSLRLSLQSALASKRFACSHLLALRFEDDEDEVYWEDVRSVMSLLTSTLVDASSRLSEVLEEVEEQYLKVDDTASESASGFNTPSSIPSPPPARTHLSFSHTMEQIVSFAPTPSHLARFAAHVDAISSALDDAREQLSQCVASLKDERTLHSPAHSSHPSMSSCGGGVRPPPGAVWSPPPPGEALEHPAILAYERLRRELGLALRECERGRERLVNIVAPQTPSTDDEPPPATLALHERENDLGPPHDGDGDDAGEQKNVGLLTVLTPSSEQPDSDDATAHLLLAASAADLPPPGIEQVFEVEGGSAGAFTRERSKLSREERIMHIRAKREGALAGTGAGGVSRLGHNEDEDETHSPSDPSSSHSRSAPLGPASASKQELWGPSGAVVQELKDVIWKVGERRRKMTEGLDHGPS